MEVAAKLHAKRFQVTDKFVAWEMLCSVKTHVFKEVGQSALALFFLYRAHLLCDIEVGAMFWPVVMAYVIGQSVGQFAYPYGGVHGDGWGLVNALSTQVGGDKQG